MKLGIPVEVARITVSKLPFRAPRRAISGQPGDDVIARPGKQVDSFVVGGQDDRRQEVAPDLAGLYQAAEQSVEGQ